MASVKLGLQPVRVGNIFCIGRNYAAHAAELGNAVESEPLVFLKPTSSLLDESSLIRLPEYSRDVHHECELVALIGKGGDDIAPERALSHVAGYGIGLDLTARDVQGEAKSKGHPWTKAKGFRGAACVSTLVPAASVGHPQRLTFDLRVNGQLRQHGDTGLMLFSLAQQISYLSRLYGLSDGDLIFTGTPEGVARIVSGDELQLELHGHVSAGWKVA
ncbi:fumarylacetoacetate hydrolase family protein [Chromobacterium phragmitis]|uniref:fumarylacetoacetate hydrolase family protein n=1 Tax=Chromobacterium amazonense TaxID=1382803 RepID=UPI0021B7CECC|nr:fumarylacetoacetate hydrolase family protein [Chromobacterium amazonense]MBM2884179.1 fumarylacetoacetate hydrolase family protein [Chromobacterium amazonense]MDE1711558.1 fumarylacetoacetate hydrolase family protein [Chromobacterium amazonense]